MTSEIRVSFNKDDNNITINIPNKNPITNSIPNDFDYKEYLNQHNHLEHFGPDILFDFHLE